MDYKVEQPEQLQMDSTYAVMDVEEEKHENGYYEEGGMDDMPVTQEDAWAVIRYACCGYVLCFATHPPIPLVGIRTAELQDRGWISEATEPTRQAGPALPVAFTIHLFLTPAAFSCPLLQCVL
jgi:hypothetical protein